MTSELVLIVLGIVALWLFVLTVFFWRTLSHYNRLIKGVSEKSLTTVLERLLKESDLAKKDIDYLKDYYGRIKKEGLLHIQKVGLVRFNPFKDTGGDQSFVLSLTDGNDNGVLISGLYSRSGTRWYAKRVANGKGVEHELTEEESKALKQASLNN